MLTLARKAELILLALTFIWGSTFVLVKIALGYSSPFLFLATRFFLATLVVRLIFADKYKIIPKETIRAGIILGIFLFFGFAFQTLGLRLTSASKSAFITSISFVLVPILAIFLTKDKPRASSWLGIGLVLVGMYFLTLPESQKFNAGDFLTLLCVGAFALQIIYVEIYNKKFDTAQLLYVQLLTTCVLSIPSLLLFDKFQFDLGSSLILTLLITSVLATSLVFYLQNKYQQYTTATKAAIIYALEPVFASFFAYFSFGETFATISLLGAGLIVCGTLVSELGKF